MSTLTEFGPISNDSSKYFDQFWWNIYQNDQFYRILDQVDRILTEFNQFLPKWANLSQLNQICDQFDDIFDRVGRISSKQTKHLDQFWSNFTKIPVNST